MLLASVNEDENGYSYEEICNQYHQRLADRTTILSILNEGFVSNYFVKRKSHDDHRMQFYKLANETKKAVIKWLDDHPIRKLPPRT